MNILILCGNSLKAFPFHEYINYDEHNLFLLINSKIAKSESNKIEEARNKYKLINEYDNYVSNGKVEFDALEIHKQFPIQSVVTLFESDIVRASKLREFFNIQGQNYASALAYRDKLVMKTNAQKYGLNVPNFKKIDVALDLIDFIKENGYPVFVKPYTAAGSVGARRIKSEDDLKEFLEVGLINKNDPFSGYQQNYEVEQYIDKAFFSINGVVMDKEIVLLHTARYNTHADLEHIEKYGYWSSETISRENYLYKKIESYIKKLILALPSPDNFVFHGEVFIDEEGNITLCEIASRPPGGGMCNAINHTFNIDIVSIAILLQVNPTLINKQDLIYKSNHYNKLFSSIFVHAKNGMLEEVKEDCELDYVSEYKLLAKKGENYNKTGGNSCEGAAIFVVSGDTEEELRNRVDQCTKWFWENSSWIKNSLI